MPKRNRHREAMKTLARSGGLPPAKIGPATPKPKPEGAPPAWKTKPAGPPPGPTGTPPARKAADGSPRPRRNPTPKGDPAAVAEHKRLKRKRYEEKNIKPHIPALLAVLRERWPAAFPEDPSKQRPWAVGIHGDLMKAGLNCTSTVLRLALKSIAKTVAYQTAVALGGARYDLQGNPRGTVDLGARDAALARLEELQRSK
ncbi:MAG: hypothetical protein HY814_10200 [Candidatus Riflebacteria bacterium]|nr:hypothetical protein [Candidatus Riflebacteria bacterium]